MIFIRARISSGWHETLLERDVGIRGEVRARKRIR